MSLVLTGVGLIALAVIVALAGLWAVRTIARIEHFKEEEPVVSFMFNAVGLIYAVILAFVVFAVWEHYTQAEDKVTAEAAALVVAYRDTTLFPQPQRSIVQRTFRSYAREVMDKEWASHGTVKPHREPDILNPVWQAYRQGNASDSVRIRLHDVEEARHLRHLAGESSLPGVFWPLLLGGGLLVISFSYFFIMRSFGAQIVMTAMLTIVIAGVLFLIFTLNSPFTGQQPVSKNPFRHAIEMFHAMDLTPAK
jgi:hypothetical protein